MNIKIIYRLFLGFGASYFNDYSYVTLYLLTLNFVFIFYNLINLPYGETFQNYRAIFCHITQFVIILVTNYYNVIKSNFIPHIKNKILPPALLELTMLFLCIGVSVASLIYNIYQFCLKIKMKMNRI